MTTPFDGYPAFPQKEPLSSDHHGMSLRDYFAAKIMATLMQGAVLPTKADRDEHLPHAAQVAYEVADAMLVARAG